MYKKEQLSNGLRIITEYIPQMLSLSVGIWIKVGSQYESEETNGISHFLEHLMFKGTEKRTSKQIAESLDNVGGYLNAITSREYTCYYAKVLQQHMPLAVDVLTDMVINSTFQPEDIDKERNVILEEIKMYEDSPDELIHDLMTQSYWPRHPLGRAILGNSQTISSLSREKIIEYFERYYRAGNIVIVAAGNVDHDSFVAEVIKCTSKLKGGMPDSKITMPTPSPQMLVYNKETEQVHFCLGTEGVARDDDSYYTMQLLSAILGSSSSSRLFQEIREERGLAYSVYSYVSAYEKAGLFAVYAGTSYENFQRVLSLTFEELQKLKENKVLPEELTRAKEQLKGSMLMALESTSARMSRLGKSELFFNRIIPIEEIVRDIDRIGIDDLLQLSQRVFSHDKYGLTVVGSLEERELTRIIEEMTQK